MLVATLADGYVKTIGPTAAPFTHYRRIVGNLGSGRTTVFWGHVSLFREPIRKRSAIEEASRRRGWESYEFEIVELVELPV